MTGNDVKIERSIEKHEPLVAMFLDSGCDSLNAFCIKNNIKYMSLYKYIKLYRKDINLSVQNSGKTKASVCAARNKSKRPSYDVLFDLYWKQGKRMSDIGKTYNVSSGSVCNWFAELGLLARDYTERVKMWMDDAHKDHFRKLANEGRIGVHKWKGEWQGNRTTSIEASLESWLSENNINFIREYQIEKESHRFDFLLLGTNLLIETDGVYFHNRPSQIIKDDLQEKYAKEKGYKVIRFTDIEIKKTQGKCFEAIKNELCIFDNE